MRSHKNVSEIARLTALVGSIPESVRYVYEQNVLGRRTLNGVIKKIGMAVKAKRVWFAVPFVAMVIFVTFVLMCKEQIRMVPRALFPWMVLGLLATMLGIFCWSWRMVRWGEEIISNSKNVFTDLEANLHVLGFCSFMDLQYDFVLGRLRTLAFNYFTLETRLGQACDNRKRVGLPCVTSFVDSSREANRILKEAMEKATIFGFKFTREELLNWAKSEYTRLEQSATPS